MASHQQQSVSHRGVRESTTVSTTGGASGVFDDALSYAESRDASTAIAAAGLLDYTQESISPQ